MKDDIINRISNFQRQGVWVFRSVVKLVLHTAEYAPIKGNSYIPLPTSLAKKRAIINMKNEDDQCFKWCITRALNPQKQNPETVDKKLREKSKELD